MPPGETTYVRWSAMLTPGEVIDAAFAGIVNWAKIIVFAGMLGATGGLTGVPVITLIVAPDARSLKSLTCATTKSMRGLTWSAAAICNVPCVKSPNLYPDCNDDVEFATTQYPALTVTFIPVAASTANALPADGNTP